MQDKIDWTKFCAPYCDEDHGRQVDPADHLIGFVSRKFHSGQITEEDVKLFTNVFAEAIFKDIINGDR